MNKHPGWRVERRETRSRFSSYEVFTSPEGVEYRRTKEPAAAVVTLETACGPLYLRLLSPFAKAALLLLLAVAPLRAQSRATYDQLRAALQNASELALDSNTVNALAVRGGLRRPRVPLLVFTVPGDFACGSGWCAGIWFKTRSRDVIIVSERPARAWVLEHELLHYLTQSGEHGPVFKALGVPVADGL